MIAWVAINFMWVNLNTYLVLEEMNTKRNLNHDLKNHNIITKHISSNPENKYNIDWENIEVLHTENN